MVEAKKGCNWKTAGEDIVLLSTQPQDVYKILGEEREVGERTFLLIAHYLAAPLRGLPFTVQEYHIIS